MDPLTENLSVSGSTASGTVTVPQGLSRTFEVEAIDGAGIVQYSGETTIDIDGTTATVSITTEGQFPSSSVLTIDEFNSGWVSLSWTRNTDNDFASYEIVRAGTADDLTSSSTRTSLETIIANTNLTYNDVTISGNTVYHYAIIVWDTEGLGLRSSVDGIITPRYFSSTPGPVNIPDLGSNGIYFLDNSFAPADAVVTGVAYTILVDNAGDPNAFWASDYDIFLSSNNVQQAIPDHIVGNGLFVGDQTDFDDDDDIEDDSDIHLIWRSTTFFNGESPNQYWGVYVEDAVGGDTGVLDFIELEIFYSSASLLKQSAQAMGKATITYNRNTGWSARARSEDGRATANPSDARQSGAADLPAGRARKGSKQ